MATVEETNIAPQVIVGRWFSGVECTSLTLGKPYTIICAFRVDNKDMLQFMNDEGTVVHMFAKGWISECCDFLGDYRDVWEEWEDYDDEQKTVLLGRRGR